MDILVIIIFLIIIIAVYVKNKNYEKSSYYQVTGNSYYKVNNDKGTKGEYLVYKYLKHYEQQGAKFLFNCYLNKGNGQTTEIDVIMIHSSGIFVFESKNYSGWIFGNENHTNWTQTFYRGKGRSAQKVSFYNPVKQNKQHIHYLRKILGNGIPIFSIIVFSDDCVLKNINVDSSTACVIQLYQLRGTIDAIIRCNSEYPDTYNVERIYNTLYPYTQVTDQVKQQHIKNIRNRN